MLRFVALIVLCVCTFTRCLTEFETIMTNRCRIVNTPPYSVSLDEKYFADMISQDYLAK